MSKSKRDDRYLEQVFMAMLLQLAKSEGLFLREVKE